MVSPSSFGLVVCVAVVPVVVIFVVLVVVGFMVAVVVAGFFCFFFGDLSGGIRGVGALGD